MSTQAQTCPKVWSPPSTPQHILSADGPLAWPAGLLLLGTYLYLVELYTLGMTNFFKHGSRSLSYPAPFKVLIAPEELVLNPSHSSQGLTRSPFS